MIIRSEQKTLETVKNTSSRYRDAWTKAVADNNTDSIRETFDLLAKKSTAVRTLAVWKITQRNRGKYTAGVDGVSLPQGDAKGQLKMKLELLNTVDIMRRPQPIRKVFILKPNGKQRPLGIPTIHDRIVQEILRTAIEPIAEYHFRDCSYGFRPKRSCQDGMQALHMKLAIPHGKRYVIEGDIEGCFDNICHNHIEKTLKEWLVPEWATQCVRKMLKTGTFHEGKIYENFYGTPQGGVISPLLANVALTSFDNLCYELEGKTVRVKGKNGEWIASQSCSLVRYADHFVYLCKSEPEAEKTKQIISEHLKNEIGLSLSEEKTTITHIAKGFNFLSFNFKKYQEKGKLRSPNKKEKKTYKNKWGEYTLLIKPEKESVLNLLRDCKLILKSHKNSKQSAIIQLLNQKIIGWAMYFRHVCSKTTFHKIDHELWWKLLHWSKRRHPQKGTKWVYRKYFSGGEGVAGFRDKETNTGIYPISKIPIRRYVKVKNNVRVYDRDPDTIAYWEKREYTNAYSQIYPVKVRRLYDKQKGTCPYCKGQMTQEDIHLGQVHIHHMKPQSLNGTNDYSNLRLVHVECHRELHASLTRNKMGELIDKGIDYLRLLK